MDAPKTLGDAGNMLWRSIAGPDRYVLRPDELAVLASACKAADMIDFLEAEWIERGRPLMSTGSMGQEVTHPLLSEQAKHQAHQAALLARLKLPDDGTASSDTSTAARKAASARWSHGA